MLLGEAHLQAEFVLLGSNLLREAEEARSLDGSLWMWFALQGILTAAANISKMLWSGAPEPTRAEQIAERKPIRDALGIQDDSCLREIKVRNSLEHYDDRLERWYHKSSGAYIARGIGDMTLLGEGMNAAGFVRYEPESGIVTFGKHSVSIPGIIAECQNLKDRHTSAMTSVFAGRRRSRPPDAAKSTHLDAATQHNSAQNG